MCRWHETLICINQNFIFLQLNFCVMAHLNIMIEISSSPRFSVLHFLGLHFSQARALLQDPWLLPVCQQLSDLCVTFPGTMLPLLNPRQLKNLSKTVLLLGTYSKEGKLIFHRYIYSPMVTGAPFRIGKKQKQPKHLLVDEWIKKTGYVSTENTIHL